jgi:hypothetical protein
MQRIVIPFNGVAGNNKGAPTQLTIPGRITAVQFNTYGADGDFSGYVQLSSSPVLVTPINQSGLNPQEIAVCGFVYSAPVSAFVGAAGIAQLIPADYAVSVGEQLFVNIDGSSGTSLSGTIVVFMS